MYKEITLKEMQAFLKPEIGWKYSVPLRSAEYVASFCRTNGLLIQVWTSIHEAYNTSRASGKDAIRVVLSMNVNGSFKALKKFPRITRQQNWQNNLGKRLEEAFAYTPGETCPKCGAVMVLRKPKKKQTWQPFWGCARFPECNGVKNLHEKK